MNYAPSGTITAPDRTVLGVLVTGPNATAPARYLVALGVVAVFALVAKNLVRGRIGRSWMAIRDRDIAAEIIGVRPLRTKLLAFGISSFYCGVAGAELVFLFLGQRRDPRLRHQPVLPRSLHDHHRGARVDPRVVPRGRVHRSSSRSSSRTLPHWLGVSLSVALLKQIELMVFGSLILFFLIVEPHGLARLWQIAKEKLRLWPFPY